MTTDPTFRMTIQETLSIKGRGTVVLGRIESGVISVSDEIWILGKSSKKTIVVNNLEVNRKVVTQAQKGDNVGIMLKEISGDDVQPGDVLAGSEADFTWQK